MCVTIFTVVEPDTSQLLSTNPPAVPDPPGCNPALPLRRDRPLSHLGSATNESSAFRNMGVWEGISSIYYNNHRLYGFFTTMKE